MTNNLVGLICDNSADRFYIDLIKHELEWQLYDDGAHAVRGKRRGSIFRKSDLIVYAKAIGLMFWQNSEINRQKAILNLIPFGFDDVIRNAGYIPWSLPSVPRVGSCVVKSAKLLRYKYELDKLLRTSSFNDILGEGIELVRTFFLELKEIVRRNDFVAAMVLSDEPFIERCILAVFNELHKPTFIFSHGLPGIYHKDLDSRSTHLMVWGRKIKENYIQAGFGPEKIHVVGNTKYAEVRTMKARWDDRRIVIVPESSIVWQQHTYEEPYCPDRNRILVYLYEIEYALKSLGYTEAYYRPHPSFDRKWISQFINRDFYKEDVIGLAESIEKATLVIGATSSVMLEYVMSGVNYIVYERQKAGIYPPFDGSDPRVPFSNTPAGLMSLMKNRAVTDTSFIEDYMIPFDTHVVTSLIQGL